MGLIKSTHTPAGLQSFSMADVEEAAKRVLLRARSQAEQLLDVAQREAEALKEIARADGARDGLEQGRIDGLRDGAEAGRAAAQAEHAEKLTRAIEALTSAAVEIEAQRQDLLAKGLQEVVQLAIAIARRITKRQGLVDESVLLANLGDAMRLVVSKADVRISLHPGQRQTLEAVLPQLQLEWPAMQHVELIEDATIAPGGCRVLTRQGEIDAELDSQLDRVVADLLPLPSDASEAAIA